MYHAPEHSSLHRAGSKLKRAAVSIRKFGFRNCSENGNHGSSRPESARRQGGGLIDTSQANSSMSSGTPTTTTSFWTHESDAYGVGNKHELDSRLPARLEFSKAELPTEYHTPMLDGREISTTAPQELAALSSLEWPRDSKSYAGTTSADECSPLGSPDSGYHSISASVYQSLCQVNEYHLPISPMSSSWSQLPSPVESIDRDRSELESPLSGHSILNTSRDRLPELAAGPPLLQSTPASPFVADDTSPSQQMEQLTAQALPGQALIESLRQTLAMLHQEWKLRLSPVPDLAPELLQLPADTILGQGLQALRDVFLGRLPQTFQAAITLIYVAVACTFVLHEDCDMPSSHELLRDMMHWRYAIDDLAERRIFAEVIDQVMACPQGLMLPPSRNRRPPMSCRSRDLSVWPDTTPVSIGGNSRSSEVLNDVDILLGRLRMGRVFSVCYKFLDGKT